MDRPRILPEGNPAFGEPAFLTVKETARFLRLSEITLCRWRIEGGGPPYRKFGRRVVYAHSDLRIWADAHRRSSTSESSSAPARPRKLHPALKEPLVKT